jgi:hypothetical protein
MQYNVQSLTNSSVDTLGLYHDTFVNIFISTTRYASQSLLLLKLDISIITSEQLQHSPEIMIKMGFVAKQIFQSLVNSLAR